MALFKKKSPEVTGIREVRFGIRIRFLILLSVVMAIIILVLTLIMYLNQRSLLEDEKNTKAMILTHILTGPAEFYLDKTIETTDEALQLKYETISTESTNFKNFNKDIEKILLTDEKGKIRFSTDNDDYRRKEIYPYIQNCLKQEDEHLSIYDYTVTVENNIGKTPKKENKKIKKDEDDLDDSGEAIAGEEEEEAAEILKFRAITYPIFLHKGNVIQIVKHFKKFYKKYHEGIPRDRDIIYNYLWKKYWNRLGTDFDPRRQIKQQKLSNKIYKAGDIDFLFLKLFGEIMILRDRRVNKNERWMFRDAWLINLKKQKLWAYVHDMPEKAKEINDKIITTMESVANHVENVRRLGALAVIFNTNRIESELDETVYRVLIIAAVMILLGLFAYRFVLNFMIQNIKKLERWARTVSAGNLDSKIVIKTNDEIGRLSDIFNKMIDEITIKYHLEKFVSSSAKSMIGKRSDTADELILGGTDRKNLVFLFSDVRGFTSFSEKNQPEAVIEILNYYLNLQANVINSKNGDIDNYVGDEIIAHFKGNKKVDRAIESAIEIMKAVDKTNTERKKKNEPIFEVGIGIHAGDVVVGNIGSDFRMTYTCIGDTVNLAARLCSSAGAGEILISKDTFKMAKKKFTTQNASPINVKGKEKKISIVKVKA